MKRLLMFLIIILCSTFFVQSENVAPTDEKINSLYEERPQLIYEMVRRLYWIERTTLSIDPPLYTAVLMKNGDLLLLPYYKDNKDHANALIGSFLQYSVLYPEIIINNFNKKKTSCTLFPILIATGVGLVTGIALTALVAILTN